MPLRNYVRHSSSGTTGIATANIIFRSITIVGANDNNNNNSASTSAEPVVLIDRRPHEQVRYKL